MNNAWLKNPDTIKLIKLQLNFDELPLYKSSSVQLWPVLGLVQGFYLKQKPCLIALFGGRSKPHPLGDYLRDLVTEMKNLAAGFAFKGKTLIIKITSVMCDAPARAYIKSHTGYVCCDKCTPYRVHLDGRMTFPDIKCPARTERALDFRQMRNITETSLHLLRQTLEWFPCFRMIICILFALESQGSS